MTEVDKFSFPVKLYQRPKPSEAIRIGAKLGPQVRCAFFENGGSCALGAMWLGYGGTPDNMPYMLSDAHARSAFGLGLEELNEICERNNTGETREQIADLLQARGK